MNTAKIEELKKANRKKNREKRYYQFVFIQARLAGKKARLFEQPPLVDLIRFISDTYRKAEKDVEKILQQRFDEIELKRAWALSAELDDFEKL